MRYKNYHVVLVQFSSFLDNLWQGCGHSRGLKCLGKISEIHPLKNHMGTVCQIDLCAFACLVDLIREPGTQAAPQKGVKLCSFCDHWALWPLCYLYFFSLIHSREKNCNTLDVNFIKQIMCMLYNFWHYQIVCNVYCVIHRNLFTLKLYMQLFEWFSFWIQSGCKRV